MSESDADAALLESDAVSNCSELESGSSTSSGARSDGLKIVPPLVVKRSSLDPAALGQSCQSEMHCLSDPFDLSLCLSAQAHNLLAIFSTEESRRPVATGFIEN